jgi:hypothetical protein
MFLDKGLLIPIFLFACIVYTIKLVLDAMARRRMVNAGITPELVSSMLKAEEQNRSHSSLRWGIVLVALAVGFGLIEAFHWNEITPGVIAALAAATGLGNLAFFAISRRLG